MEMDIKKSSKWGRGAKKGEREERGDYEKRENEKLVKLRKLLWKKLIQKSNINNVNIFQS